MNMDKKTITKQQYLALHGLSVLASSYNEKLREIEQQVIDITGEDTKVYQGGHCGDFTYGENESYGVDGLLDRLKLTVENTPTNTEERE